MFPTVSPLVRIRLYDALDYILWQLIGRWGHGWEAHYHHRITSRSLCNTPTGHIHRTCRTMPFTHNCHACSRHNAKHLVLLWVWCEVCFQLWYHQRHNGPSGEQPNMPTRWTHSHTHTQHRRSIKRGCARSTHRDDDTHMCALVSERSRRSLMMIAVCGAPANTLANIYIFNFTRDTENDASRRDRTTDRAACPPERVEIEPLQTHAPTVRALIRVYIHSRFT